MNGLIQKLAEQARKYADENRPGSFVKYDPEWFVLYNEKFAELIVRETLQVARAGIAYGDCMEDAVYRYFGVEE